MKFYIHRHINNSINRETVARGAYLLGHEFAIVDSHDEIPEEDLYTSGFYGSVGFSRKVIDKLGYERRWLGHVPEELYKLVDRKIKVSTLSEAIKSTGVFIKPIPEAGKSFNGFIYKVQMDLIKIANVSLEDMVITSDPVSFVSEWRCCVLNKEFVDIRPYSGNFRIQPDHRIIDRVIEAWVESPVAYSCDIGVLDSGETTIVEINDVMSLGSYGVPPMILASMIEKRWEEIHKKKSMK